MKYTVTAPHYIDFEFSCRPHDARRFGDRRYALLFWADYMNDVEDVALHFRGVNEPGGDEQWIAADAPPDIPTTWVAARTATSQHPALEYDADHNFKLNRLELRVSPVHAALLLRPRGEQGMTLMLMFDRTYSEEDEMRFSLFKFKVNDQVRRPAWDFQYVIHRVETGKQYGFRGRLVWKKFVSEEDCLQEYETWAAALPTTWQPRDAVRIPSETAPQAALQHSRHRRPAGMAASTDRRT